MSKFKVGDICEVIHCDYDPSIKGREVTIIGPLEWRRNVDDGRVWMGYETDLFLDGYSFHPPENYLRLKSPPPSGEQLIRDMFLPKPIMVPA